MDTEEHHPGAPSADANIYEVIGKLAADAALSPPLVLKHLKADVRRTAHPHRALTNLHRFLHTGFSSAWLRDFQDHRLLQQILLELFAQSQFLADILVRNPELFRWLTTTNVLKKTKLRDQYLAEAIEATSLFMRTEKKIDSLKRFQRRELLRVGARQILKEADVRTTSAELSALADSIIGAVLELSYKHMSEGAQATLPTNLAVIGLGKLGGEELNFSSDIDLMFVYDNDGPLKGALDRISTLHEYYSRISEFVVRRLSEHTGEGHLYRVDMRLRPDGQSGPLAMSRSAFMAYYESRGEMWERQMLTKARVVAGDSKAGEGWMVDIQPFVFPKTLLTGPLEEIANIKARIESKIAGETNIKLGKGGIRDVEFTVQALQLLNGGANEKLRERNTLAAITKLVDSKHLASTEGTALEGAYIFLRTVEDRLQLLHGLQKHSVPESSDEKRVLASQLGYGSIGAFSHDLELHQRKIRRVFSSVFGLKQRPGSKKARAVESPLRRQELRRLGFVDPETAAGRIRALQDALPSLSAPEELRSFLAHVRRWQAPDRCLDNYLALASSGTIRRTLGQAASKGKTLDLILLVCSHDSKHAQLLSREPLLFEALVGQSEDLVIPGAGWSFLKNADLNRYSAYNEFKAVLRYLTRETSIDVLTREMSDLADDVVQTVFYETVDEFAELKTAQIALLALGKLGGRELSVGSDLDLVLLYSEGGQVDISKAVNALGRKVRQRLEGAYSVDFRLRPEGKNAPLATEFGYYMEYLRTRASLWERQSLVKARIIVGVGDFADDVLSQLVHFAYRTPLPGEWRKQILDMRQRMASERAKAGQQLDLKLGKGGLVDLEFLVQAIQLRHGADRAELIQPNTFEAVASALKLRVAGKQTIANVSRNLDYLRRLEASIRLNTESKDFVLPSESDRLQAIAAMMSDGSVKRLKATLRRITTENRKLFNLVMKSLPR